MSKQPEIASRITVRSVDSIGLELYRQQHGEPQIATEAEIRKLLSAASSAAGQRRFTDAFLWSEWNDVVDAWQLRSTEDYRKVARLAHKTRLPDKQRDVLWKVFEQVGAELAQAGRITMSQLFAAVTRSMEVSETRPFDFVVVDEAQDVSVAQMRFFAALAGGKANGLTFTGDLGQRI